MIPFLVERWIALGREGLRQPPCHPQAGIAARVFTPVRGRKAFGGAEQFGGRTLRRTVPSAAAWRRHAVPSASLGAGTAAYKEILPKLTNYRGGRRIWARRSLSALIGTLSRDDIRAMSPPHSSRQVRISSSEISVIERSNGFRFRSS